MTDRDVTELWALGLFSSMGMTAPVTEAKRLTRRHLVTLRFAAEAQAADVAENVVYQVPAALFPGGAKLIEAYITATGAVANHATDIRTFTISNRNGAGGDAVSMATYATTTGSNGALVAFTPKTFSLSGTAANLVAPAGGVITHSSIHGASGVAVGIYTVELLFEAV